ncbi:MAG: head GIN domain-containing protein, partial [Myxococcota bacterium]
DFLSLLLLSGTTMQLEPFESVAASVSADLQIDVNPDAQSSHQLTVEGDEKDIERLKIEVVDNRLKIGTKKKDGWFGSWSSSGRVRMRVTVKTLKDIALAGSGDTVVRGLQGGAFEVRSAGSGDVKLSGEIGDFDLKLSGSGDLEAATLDAGTVRIKVVGSGSVSLEGRANTLLVKVAGSGEIEAGKLAVTSVDAKVMGSGDVEVCASGEVNSKTMGSGDVQNVCD